MYRAKQTYINENGAYVIAGTKVNSVAGNQLKFYEKVGEEANEDHTTKTRKPRARKTAKQD
ncbi:MULTISPECIES: hypothetical protein [unclassified Lactococcus]|uniref:hypothetical protein n=1 Tax=unclassified Lactococcus TaxID=2643510 RepID=UPI0011C9B85E|nr:MULTISPECIES: hypothetical protein [unclassified Lactococcus]MQW21995.1 hypothetical protein [Lactococcus sp. dk101]TXK36824.1 hypothetical protein FVP42_10635 [Lactococcus sp. dk310]TXK47478.1 hypothetical protein FVP43_10205 [Lactococcus sp. dk322]